MGFAGVKSIMATNAKSVINQALELSAAERVAIAEQLLISIESPDAQIDVLWSEEAESRLAALESGELSTIPLEDVIAKNRKL